MTQDQSPNADLPDETSSENPEVAAEDFDLSQETSENLDLPQEPGETPAMAEARSHPDATPPISPYPAQSPEKSFTQTLQEYWERIRPGLTVQTIKLLRGTSQVLEGAAQKLEESQPPSDTETAGEFALPLATDTLWEKVQPAWAQFQKWWAVLLRQVRSRLPENWNRQLSDRALTGAIAGILVILLWTTSGLFSSKPQPKKVAVTPAPKVAPSTRVKASPPKTTTPAAKPSASPQVKVPVQPTPGKSGGETAIAPQPPSPSPAAKPAPPPLKLTPEQKLIARIQDQVAEISNQYAAGLIQAVQANFRSSRLTVNVGKGWYGLSQPQQSKLADEMLGRAKQLNFSKLEITDPDGSLLARSPVVGSEMILLKSANSV